MDQASSPEYDRDLSPEDRDRVFRERYAQALAEMRYGMGPLSVAPVFSPNASGAKVSANVAGVEPYVVIDPSTGRPTVVEQGVTYGSGTPESGYQLRYSKNERTGQPVYSGAYRRRLDRDSEITAQGSYVPMPGRDAYQAMLQYRKRFAEGGEATADADDQIKKLYRDTLAREADTGGLEYWRKEFGPEVDVAERMRFIEGAQPEVQKRMAAGDTTLPAYMRVAPEVRSALQSTDITTDEYKKLANYFGNQWIAGEAEDPASLTRRDYIERPRSGYDLATFLATRSQQHGAQADTAQRLSNLLAPYMGNVGKATSVGGESLDQYVVNPLTGQTEIAKPLGVDNTYRIYRAPHHGSIGDTGNRYAVGMDYRVDPATGQTEFVAPYASPYTDTGHNDWQVPLGILGTAAGMYFFPGMDFSSMLSRGAITLATEGAKRAFKHGGEVTNFVKRQAGSPEEGEAAAESRYDMANNRLRGLNEELQDKIEMYRQGQITAKDLQEFFPGYSTFDLDRMFGTTDTDLPRHPNMAQPRLTPKFLADALNLEDILKKETETQLREGRKHPFLLRKDMPPGWETNMAQGGEVTKFVKRQAGSPEEGEVAEQMTVGTIPRIMAQASEEPGIVTAKEITQPATRSAQAMKAYLEASIPDVKVVEDPMLERKGRRGQVSMDVPNVILISPKEKNMGREAVLLHEAEHSRVGKAVQGMPEKEQFDNDIRFDRLYGDKGSTRSRMVRNFVDNKDKIEKFFGVNIPDVYFEKMMYKNQSRFGSAGALFEEQIATLSALEQLTNKSITKGMPELFPDDKAAAIYDAITGLRQTRLDAKDLPPFTPQYRSGMDWIKEKLQSLRK